MAAEEGRTCIALVVVAGEVAWKPAAFADGVLGRG